MKKEKDSMVFTGVIDKTGEILKCKICGEEAYNLIKNMEKGKIKYSWICDCCFLEPRVATLTQRNKQNE